MNIPLDESWSQDEIVVVAEFFDCMARVYEHGVNAEEVLRHYEQLRQVVPAKHEEKRLFKEMDQEIGHSCYKVIQAAKQAEPQVRIKL